jgi:hypothetical protein
MNGAFRVYPMRTDPIGFKVLRHIETHDLRKGELLVADALPANIEAIVRDEFAWLDSFFQAHSKAA